MLIWPKTLSNQSINQSINTPLLSVWYWEPHLRVTPVHIPLCPAHFPIQPPHLHSLRFPWEFLHYLDSCSCWYICILYCSIDHMCINFKIISPQKIWPLIWRKLNTLRPIMYLLSLFDISTMGLEKIWSHPCIFVLSPLSSLEKRHNLYKECFVTSLFGCFCLNGSPKGKNVESSQKQWHPPQTKDKYPPQTNIYQIFCSSKGKIKPRKYKKSVCIKFLSEFELFQCVLYGSYMYMYHRTIKHLIRTKFQTKIEKI